MKKNEIAATGLFDGLSNDEVGQVVYASGRFAKARKRTIEEYFSMCEHVAMLQAMLAPKGKFRQWSEEVAGVTVRTAQKWAAAWNLFGKNSEHLTSCSQTLIERMSAPSVPRKAASEFVRIAKKGSRKLDAELADGLIDKYNEQVANPSRTSGEGKGNRESSPEIRDGGSEAASDASQESEKKNWRQVRQEARKKIEVARLAVDELNQLRPIRSIESVQVDFRDILQHLKDLK